MPNRANTCAGAAAARARFALLLVLGSGRLACSLDSALAAPDKVSFVEEGERPIRKVITLIEEMKATVEKEVKEDEDSYNKYKCWCETEEKRASEAVKANSAKVEELTAFVEEGTARVAQLKTEIEQLEKDIAEDMQTLAEATEIRAKEKEEFEADEADMKETVSALYEAIPILEKVQLVQKNPQAPVAALPATATAALLQVSNIIKVKRNLPKYRGVMQKDLFDLLSSLQPEGPAQSGKFLPASSSPTAALLRTRSELIPGRELLPWEKTDAEKGADSKPNELMGAAAGAKSYNARSSQILGILQEMLNEFSRDLAEAQKIDFKAELDFLILHAQKTGEIQTATKQKEAKVQEMAELDAKIAEAKEDIGILSEAVEKDEAFLGDLGGRCEKEGKEYDQRVKDRQLEIVALQETLEILTSDEARDLYSKTMGPASFLQISRGQHKAESQAEAKAAAVRSASKKLGEVARRHKSWALAQLASSMQFDAIEKVKETMDKMIAELKKQQAEEVEKNDFCVKRIDETEDDILVANTTKKDLAKKHNLLVNKLETLRSEIEELKASVAGAEISLKQAGEQRKEENMLFQTSVSDQRACVVILKKALARLKEVYAEALVQKKGRADPEEALRKSGWSGASQPPPEGADYQKSGAGAGVVQMMSKIINEAEQVEAELVVDEQNAQEDYAKVAQELADSITADREAIVVKVKEVAATETEKVETEEAQEANLKELETLTKLLAGHHADCDFVMKYFSIRQTARQEEIDAINEAKAILSGANFGF